MLDTMTDYIDDEARLAAVRRRDPAADGAFVYSVLTTGVFCRPSCAARPARRENIGFHASPAAAQQAGYRPCKRCRPDTPPRAEREAALVAAACRMIDAAEEPPRLSELAAEAGLSPHHFHRMFRRIAGVTPKAYALARRQARVQTTLVTGAPVTAAIFEAGFGSTTRFYAESATILGMTPRQFRTGAPGEVVRWAIGRSTLGAVLVATTARGLCAILLGDDADALGHDLRRRFPRATVEPAEPGFADQVHRVVAMVDDPRRGLDLPLDIIGTAFQRRVWEALRAIPAGQTVSYGDVAARLGTPSAVRAVAGAVAANKLAIAIPCHRVVGATGALTGYRWGVARKQALLAREREG